MSPLKISLEIISILALIALAFIHRKGRIKYIWYTFFIINIVVHIFFINDRYQKSKTILNLENDSKIKTQQINKLEKRIDPLNKSLASATAKVEIVIKTDKQISGTRYNVGGYLAFVKNGQSLLMTAAQYTDAYAHAEGEVLYKLDLQMSAENSAVGKPIEILQTPDLIQIILTPFVVPENSQVVTGTASVTINGNERADFKILPQQMQGKNILIVDVKNKFQTTQ